MKNDNKKQIRVRFAPSPTGLLHVGSFRTALFNWLFARKNRGKFILRIEDTDQVRSKNDFLISQLADLRWMELDWDEGPEIGGEYGPYFQMQKLDTYREQAERLLKDGKSYYCYCTAEELEAERKKCQSEGKDTGYAGKCRSLTQGQILNLKDSGRKPCVRFKINREGYTIIQDLIKGEVRFDNQLLDDFVILKSDGIPTYNFAVVVDDHRMKITHIIRGDEHISNTPKQVQLFDALGYEKPLFCHIPIILNEDKTKLSKRRGAVHLLEYRERGYLKEALLNFLALLGWAPGNNREILTRDELIESFSLDGISRHPAIFDEKKLQWMNGQYLNLLPADEIIERLKPFIAKLRFNPETYDFQWYIKAVELFRGRMKTLVEFAENLQYYFSDVLEYDSGGIKKHFSEDFIPEALSEMARRIEQMEVFSRETLEKTLREYSQEIEQPAAKLIHAVRLACTGRTATPPVFNVMEMMGKEKLILRLREAAKFILCLKK